MGVFAYPRSVPVKQPGQTDDEFAGQMRALGLRRSDSWVPDLTNPQIVEEYKRQLRALAEHQRHHPEELIELTKEDLAGWK